MAPPLGSRNSIPAGWYLSDHVNKKGIKVQCYTNALGEKFFTMEDLMRYIKYAKMTKLSIYSPNFKALTIREPKPIEARNVKPDKETNQGSSAEARKQPDKAARKHRSRSLVEIYAQTAVVELSNNPELLPSPAENSNRNSNKDPVSASVTDAEPRRASRRLAGKQPEYLPTLSDIEALEGTSMPKPTWAISWLAKHQREHIPNPAREVTNVLEPRQESRRLPKLVIKRVPASF